MFDIVMLFANVFQLYQKKHLESNKYKRTKASLKRAARSYKKAVLCSPPREPISLLVLDEIIHRCSDKSSLHRELQIHCTTTDEAYIIILVIVLSSEFNIPYSSTESIQNSSHLKSL